MTPEGKVKKEIKAYLDEIGAYQFWPTQTGYGKRTVDCLACIKGAFVAIEVKAPGKKADKFQLQIMNEINDVGGYAICIDNRGKLKEYVSLYIL